MGSEMCIRDRLAQTKGTTIVPFFFDGRNSVVYQAARRVSVTLGYSLMFREICKQMNRQVKVTVRTPIDHKELDAFATRNDITDFLRRRTYGQQDA